MAAATSRYVELAKQLHPRLQRFFAKYPPTQILPKTTAENTIKDGATANPFLPHKHPVTGRWQDPEFSLRRQAELVKLARSAGVEELMPFTHKGTEERIRKRVEEGLQVKGTGVGQKVKGHLHERMLATKYVATALSPYLLAAAAAAAAQKSITIGLLGHTTKAFLDRTVLTIRAGWRRGEQLCWACPDWSGNGEK